MPRPSAFYLGAVAWGAFAATLVASCTSDTDSGPRRDGSSGAPDATFAEQGMPDIDSALVDRPVIPFDDASMPLPNTFCSLPGSIVSTASGLMIVPGESDAEAPDPMTLRWLNVPPGVCGHFFAQVPEVRQLRFAPGGDLFAASPSTPCSGGAVDGLGAIFVLPDDDHNGVAD
jgi:hypothetical protein